MVKCKCIKRNRKDQKKDGVIVEYILVDDKKNRQSFSPEKLKLAIKSKKIEAVNLTLTKDNRLIFIEDKKVKKAKNWVKIVEEIFVNNGFRCEIEPYEDGKDFYLNYYFRRGFKNLPFEFDASCGIHAKSISDLKGKLTNQLESIINDCINGEDGTIFINNREAYYIVYNELKRKLNMVLKEISNIS